jgi:hypothetical protein
MRGARAAGIVATPSGTAPPDSIQKECSMPRYIVERSFPEGLSIPMDEAGRRAVAGVVKTNAEEGVTWVHSYVNPERTQTFCVYDGPSPEAIRHVAQRNGLPVNRLTEVRVLDPYFYSA